IIRQSVGDYPWKDMDWEKYNVAGQDSGVPFRFSRNVLLWALLNNQIRDISTPEGRKSVQPGDIVQYQWKDQREGNRPPERLTPEWASHVTGLKSDPKEYWTNHTELVVSVHDWGIVTRSGNKHDAL